MSAATSRFFVDTNLLLYAFDSRDVTKQQAAIRWRDALWEKMVGRVSWQVLNEFYANAVGKVKIPLPVARAVVESYAEWQPAEFTVNGVRRAWYWMDHASLSYWDALIVAAAEQSACQWLLSEDFQTGRQFGTVLVVNPFQAGPDEFFPGESR
jgi:predicted nucleic acid-binding protein